MTNVDKLDKKTLRNMADKLGVEWSKQTDDEKSLALKVKAALSKATATEEAPEAREDDVFDTSRRAPTENATDPKTGKPVKLPTACFGWFFTEKPAPGAVNCMKDCPHWKPCKGLSQGAEKALAALAEEEAVEAEASAVTAEVVEQVEKATKAKAEKKGKGKAEPLTAPVKRKGALDEDSELKLAYDLDFVISVEDDEVRKFFKHLLKAHGEGGTTTVGAVIDAFIEATGLDDRGAVLGEMLPEMLSDGTLVLA